MWHLDDFFSSPWNLQILKIHNCAIQQVCNEGVGDASHLPKYTSGIDFLKQYFERTEHPRSFWICTCLRFTQKGSTQIKTYPSCSLLQKSPFKLIPRKSVVTSIRSKSPCSTWKVKSPAFFLQVFLSYLHHLRLLLLGLSQQLPFGKILRGCVSANSKFHCQLSQGPAQAN